MNYVILLSLTAVVRGKNMFFLFLPFLARKGSLNIRQKDMSSRFFVVTLH